MAGFNKVILLGRLTADPELKQTTSGISICNFSVAVDRRTSRNNEQSQQTVDFINIVAWRERAEFVCRYFKKGNPMLSCGQLQVRSWQDAQGQKRYATEVVADEVSFTQSSSQNGNAGAAPVGDTGAGHYTPDAYSAPSFNSAPGATFEEIPNDESLPF